MKKNRSRKIIYGVACVFILMLSSSCEKWLDVRPSNQFDEDEQFETEQGYIDVLIGTYQSMTNQDTYGAELSFRFVDVLAQLYGNKSATGYYGLSARYSYTQENDDQHSPKRVIDSIWVNQYNSIAQLNYLLRHMDTRPAAVSQTNFSLIKGESLALRAFLHFDLLRLFAPAYSGSTASQRTIPYVKDFSVSPGAVLTFDEVIEHIKTDLLASIELQQGFQDIDQIILNQGSTSSELFQMFRKNRMNYWAAKALLARVYLYIGDKENAKKYAEEVINSAHFTFIPVANRIFDERDERSNLSFTQEHIFSLYHSGLHNVADNFFKTEALDPEPHDLFNTKAILDGIYESTLPGYGTDIRSSVSSPSRWSEHSTAVVYTKKYYSDRSTNVNQRLIPLIRLPEMYYIAAEASATIEEALVYLNAVRDARGIGVQLTTSQVANETALINEIFKEYRKEYYAEGHL